MKIAVIHFTPCTDKSTMASAKIAKYIAGATGADLIDNGRHAMQVYDVLFLVNGPWAFCEFREKVLMFASRAKKVIWVQNDYNIAIPSPIQKGCEFHGIFTTIPDQQDMAGLQYVNWNQLTYRPCVGSGAKVPGLFYHGAYRKGREADFIKYFNDAPYPVTVSTTVKGLQGFKAHCKGKGFRVVPPIASISDICAYDAALYIEDADSHEQYHSPANRFYEYLSAGVPIFFDRACSATFKRYGLKGFGDYSVRNAGELNQFLADRDVLARVAHDQQRLWAGVNYQLKLLEEFSGAVSNLRLGVSVSASITTAPKPKGARKGFLFNKA